MDPLESAFIYRFRSLQRSPGGGRVGPFGVSDEGLLEGSAAPTTVSGLRTPAARLLARLLFERTWSRASGSPPPASLRSAPPPLTPSPTEPIPALASRPPRASTPSPACLPGSPQRHPSRSASLRSASQHTVPPKVTSCTAYTHDATGRAVVEETPDRSSPTRAGHPAGRPRSPQHEGPGQR